MRPLDTGRRRGRGQAIEPVGEQRVQIAHQQQAEPWRARCDAVSSARSHGSVNPAASAVLARPLDGHAVGHRVGERDAELDDVGDSGDGREPSREPVAVGEAGRHECDDRRCDLAPRPPGSRHRCDRGRGSACAGHARGG